MPVTANDHTISSENRSEWVIDSQPSSVTLYFRLGSLKWNGYGPDSQNVLFHAIDTDWSLGARVTIGSHKWRGGWTHARPYVDGKRC